MKIQYFPLPHGNVGLEFPVLLYRRVFTNKDDSTGLLYLVTNNLGLTAAMMIETTYKQRWCVEAFHKNIKSNTGLVKFPTSAVLTQSNHIFMSLYVTAIFACLSLKKLNTFALKRKLYLKAIQVAFAELQLLKGVSA